MPSMRFEIPDVDLDVKDRDRAVGILGRGIGASQLDQHGKLVKHKSGVYFQSIPVDPVTRLAAFPYDVAEQLGYYKVDLLSYHVYDMVESEKHLNRLLKKAENPDYPWHWFQEDRFFTNDDPRLQITQLSRHKYLCEKYPPGSVQDVAILNALIRPRKKYLIGESWTKIRELVWQKLDSEGDTHYFFKKSHAVAFALAILVQMLMIDEITG